MISYTNITLYHSNFSVFLTKCFQSLSYLSALKSSLDCTINTYYNKYSNYMHYLVY